MEFLKSLETKDIVTLVGITATLLVGLLSWSNSLKSGKRTLFVNAITSERVKWMSELKELLAEYVSLTTVHDHKRMLKDQDLEDYFQRLIFLVNKIKLHLNFKGKKDRQLVKIIEEIYSKIYWIYKIERIRTAMKKKEEWMLLFADAYSEDRDYVTEILIQEIGEEKIENLAKDYELNQDVDVFKPLAEILQRKKYKEAVNDFGHNGIGELDDMVKKLVEKSQIYLKHEWERVKEEANRGNLKSASIAERLLENKITRPIFLPVKRKYRQLKIWK